MAEWLVINDGYVWSFSTSYLRSETPEGKAERESF